MSPFEWLVKFLKARGVKGPDARMLYSYRVSDGEYLSLQQLLTQIAVTSDLDQVFRNKRGLPPLFVLYASEWWRREYEGGAWRWDPIIKSISGKPDSMSTGNRTECVINGFRFWGHRPSGAGKIYFGAIVAHGGLPLKAIGKRSNKLADLMANTLKLASRYRWDAEQMVEVIAERANDLPGSLRRNEIYELIAKMIASVLELKQEYSLEGVEDPISLLNDADSDWRNRFPLALNDEPAQVLLAGLVKEASKHVEIISGDVFVVQRRLVKNDSGGFSLLSTVQSPNAVNADVLSNMLGLKSLPRYFSIDIVLQERQPLIEARQLLGADEATVTFTRARKTWRGAEACHDHAIQVRDVSGDLLDSAVTLPGGEELLSDEPWVFVSRDGKHSFVAAGSARVPEDEACVVIGDEWSTEKLTPETSIERLGDCHIEDKVLGVYSLNGDVNLVNNGCRYRVRTRQAVGAGWQYVWEGRRFGYNSTPQRIFKGTPALYKYSEEGDRVRVNSKHLQWFVAGTTERIDDAALASGPVDVYLIDEGERQARYRFVVLDERADFKFLAGDDANSGDIEIRNISYAEISVTGEAVNAVINKAAHGCEINLMANGMPPEAVNVRLLWPRCQHELLLRLPFPSVGGYFYDGEGRRMAERAYLPMSGLLGARLRIFDSNPQACGNYRLNMNLVSRRDEALVSNRLRIDKKMPVRQENISELRLLDLQRDIETLMGYSDDVDAVVEIALVFGTSSRASVCVSRYDLALERDADGFSVPDCELKEIDSEKLECIELMAAPLSCAEIDPHQIVQEKSQDVQVARWSADDLDNDLSPWLVYPGEASSLFFRPAIWGGEVVHEIDCQDVSLGNAIAIPGEMQRYKAIKASLEMMASDYMESSWEMIDHLWDVFGHLPMSSIDVWRVISKKPALCACLVMRSQMSDDQLSLLISRLRDEMGVIWELISIDAWRNAAILLKDYWSRTLGEDIAADSFGIILKSRLKMLSDELPSLSLMFEIIQFEVLGEPGEEIAKLGKAMTSNPRYYTDRLWNGSEAMVQSLLFRAHNPDYEEWPERNLLDSSLEALDKRCSQELKDELVGRARKALILFWDVTSDDFKRSVANVPVMCALWAVVGVSPKWWLKQENRVSLRKVRSFDPLWFELAYKEGLSACLALGLYQPKVRTTEEVSSL